MMFILQILIIPFPIPFPKEDAGIKFVELSGPDTFVLDDTLKCIRQVEKIVENEESIDNISFFYFRVTIWLAEL